MSQHDSHGCPRSAEFGGGHISAEALGKKSQSSLPKLLCETWHTVVKVEVFILDCFGVVNGERIPEQSSVCSIHVGSSGFCDWDALKAIQQHWFNKGSEAFHLYFILHIAGVKNALQGTSGFPDEFTPFFKYTVWMVDVYAQVLEIFCCRKWFTTR
jgi:hypothetical protein